MTTKSILFLATGFGTGYFPKIPGTAGSIVGVLIFYFLKGFRLGPYVATVMALIFLAVWISTQAEILLGRKDDQRIVIDEIAGILVTFVFVPFTWKAVLIGFVFFRIFDIWKPFPIRLCQNRLPAGWGIVGDDVMAGIYANVVLQILFKFM